MRVLYSFFVLILFIYVRSGEIEKVEEKNLGQKTGNPHPSDNEIFEEISLNENEVADKNENFNYGENKELETAVEKIIEDLLKPYQERLKPSRAKSMRQELKRNPHLLKNNFDQKKFKELVADKRACGKIEIAVHDLFGYSNMFGVYHVGIYVCMIEIHYHSPGIEYWQPKQYHTRFPGGHYTENQEIKILNSDEEVVTNMSFHEIVNIIKEEFEGKYTKKNYNVFTHNCLDFARELVNRIADITPGEKVEFPFSAIFPAIKPWVFVKRSKTFKKSHSALARSGSILSKRFSTSFSLKSLSFGSFGKQQRLGSSIGEKPRQIGKSMKPLSIEETVDEV